MTRRLPEIRTGLYVVATPIGTASDISLRALDLISSADVLIAEDTRNLLKLMRIHQIKLARRPLLSYHDHNGFEQRQKILRILQDKKSIAFVSDAGTPLIADPGFRLISEVISGGFYVSGVPGASAVLASLMISGLPTDKFFFGGFIPPKSGSRKEFFRKYLDIPGTLVFYETPSRLLKTLSDLSIICGNNREIVVCRELTKKFEDVQRGTLKDVFTYFASLDIIRGELVILLEPSPTQTLDVGQIEQVLINAMDYMSFKDSVSFVSQHLNISRKQVYTKALSIKNARQ